MSEEQRERFTQLIMPLRDRLMRFARGMTTDRAEAQDLVSDAILAAYEGFHRLESYDAFLSYLFTIVVRLHRRRRWRARIFGRNGEFYDMPIVDTRPSVEVAIDIEALYRALDRLPDKVREALVLHELSGLKVEEIQRIQGGSLSGVKSRLARGRARLATMLGAVEGIASSDEVPQARPVPTNDKTFVLYSGSQSHG